MKTLQKTILHYFMIPERDIFILEKKQEIL